MAILTGKALHECPPQSRFSSGSGRIQRWALRLLCLIGGLLLCQSPARAGDDNLPAVAAIEAAYLTKFAPFIEWPATVSGEPSTLCVLHADRIENLIQHTGSVVPDGIDAGDHASVRVVGTSNEAGSCRVLFAGTPEVEEDAEILAALSAAPVLTVTSEAESGRKGVINFVIRDDRVRFEIDEAAAMRHGLSVSSKLLSLAVPVPPKS